MPRINIDRLFKGVGVVRSLNTLLLYLCRHNEKKNNNNKIKVIVSWFK